MIIKTKYLGEIEIESKQILNFESGLPGFEEENQFVLLNLSNEVVFQVLQSIQSPELAFFVANPYYLFDEYEFKLNDHTIESLNIQSQKDIIVLTVMTLREPFIESTVNLKAPLIINLKNQVGKQYILEDANYSMRAEIPTQKIESGIK